MGYLALKALRLDKIRDGSLVNGISQHPVPIGVDFGSGIVTIDCWGPLNH